MARDICELHDAALVRQQNHMLSAEYYTQHAQRATCVLVMWTVMLTSLAALDAASGSLLHTHNHPLAALLFSAVLWLCAVIHATLRTLHDTVWQFHAKAKQHRGMSKVHGLLVLKCKHTLACFHLGPCTAANLFRWSDRLLTMQQAIADRLPCLPLPPHPGIHAISPVLATPMANPLLLAPTHEAANTAVTSPPRATASPDGVDCSVAAREAGDKVPPLRPAVQLFHPNLSRHLAYAYSRSSTLGVSVCTGLQESPDGSVASDQFVAIITKWRHNARHKARDLEASAESAFRSHRWWVVGKCAPTTSMVLLTTIQLVSRASDWAAAATAETTNDSGGSSPAAQELVLGSLLVVCVLLRAMTDMADHANGRVQWKTRGDDTLQHAHLLLTFAELATKMLQQDDPHDSAARADALDVLRMFRDDMQRQFPLHHNRHRSHER